MTDPLHWSVPIVDKQGKPTQEFIRKFEEFRSSGTASAVDTAAAQATASAAQVTAAAAQATANAALAEAQNGGASAFTDLTDVPAQYTGAGGEYLRVKATLDGVEFAALPTLGSGGAELARDRYGPPTAAMWAHIRGTNSVLPTVTDTADAGLLFNFGASPSGDGLRVATKAKPAATDYSIITRVEATTFGTASDFHILGLVLSDGTKYVSFGFATNGSSTGPQFLRLDKWTAQTTFSASLVSPLPLGGTALHTWLRIDVVGGVPTTFFVSTDGSNWIEVYSGTGVSSFMTFTEVGIGMTVNGNSAVASTTAGVMSVLYYSDADFAPTVLYPGAKGDTGSAGADGVGVPAGGTTNQALVKASAADFDTGWATVDAAFVGALDLTGGTLTGGLAIQPATGGVNFIVQAGGAANAIFYRADATAAGPQINGRKSRGTVATPTICNTNDAILQVNAAPYNGASFTTTGEIDFILIEPTPSNTAMGTALRFMVAPFGTNIRQEVVRVTYDAGMSMFGPSNVVIDQNRCPIPPAYTFSQLSALTGVAAGALAYITDSADTIAYRGTVTTGGGTGKCLVQFNGTAWEYH